MCLNEPQLNLEYSGYCKDCNTHHSLPYYEAMVHAQKLMEDLRIHKRLDFDVPTENANPKLETNYLYSFLGQMFGVLVCQDEVGKEVILKAFSSKHNGVWEIEGWVPPIFNLKTFNAIVERGNQSLHPKTDYILTLDKNSKEYAHKIAERKAVSHSIMAELYKLYQIKNFKDQTKEVLDIYQGEKTPPTGTGDCCGPKLLHYAASKNLTPLSLAEFYMGKESGDKVRQDGEFFSSCQKRCQPILGYMLCGIKNENI